MYLTKNLDCVEKLQGCRSQNGDFLTEQWESDKYDINFAMKIPNLHTFTLLPTATMARRDHSTFMFAVAGDPVDTTDRQNYVCSISFVD